jgi:hypothetical protein
MIDAIMMPSLSLSGLLNYFEHEEGYVL